MAAIKRTQAELQVARMSRERREKLRLDRFTTDEKPICRRAAAFICWVRDLYPYSFVTYEEITQAVFKLGRAPSSSAQYVKSVRGQMSSTSKILSEKHRTSLITLRGVGVRAAVNDTDMLEQSVTKKAEAHRRTGDALSKLARMIDPRTLQKEIEAMGADPVRQKNLLDLAQWFKDDLCSLLKTVNRPSHAKALLPPPPTIQNGDH